MINLNNPYIIYLLCGVGFNLLFDVLVSLLNDHLDESKIRFTMAQRLVTLFTWPFYLVILVGGTVYHIFKSNDNE